jgi:serine/threonine protein kinase
MVSHGYSAPEMYSNLSFKGRYTDIYSLGATFYYLLSANKPLPTNDRKYKEMPALREVNPRISIHLSSAIMKAFEMNPEDRFQNVQDFKKEMSLLASEKEIERKENKENSTEPSFKIYILEVLMFVGLFVAIIILLFKFR